jgi:CRISPR/Cas system endoribonuclease Cas6 (RAMP superfamily)
MLRFRRAMQVGFVGRVTYGLMADDEPLRCQLNALAGAALYTGVGMKTTMGMGQCRRVTA